MLILLHLAGAGLRRVAQVLERRARTLDLQLEVQKSHLDRQTIRCLIFGRAADIRPRRVIDVKRRFRQLGAFARLDTADELLRDLEPVMSLLTSATPAPVAELATTVGIPTAVLAALVSASVAAAVATLVLSVQRRDQYQERLRSAIRSTMAAVLRFSDAALVKDGLEEERSAVLAQAEFSMLVSVGRGEDAQLAALMGTEFAHLSALQNSTRTENTAELIAHLGAMANPKVKRKLLAEAVHRTAAKFTPYPLAPDSAVGPNPSD